MDRSPRHVVGRVCGDVSAEPETTALLAGPVIETVGGVVSLVATVPAMPA